MEQLNPEQLHTLMGAVETKKLLALLQRDGGESWNKAIVAVREGNYDLAQSILKPMLSGTDAASIVHSLRKKIG